MIISKNASHRHPHKSSKTILKMILKYIKHDTIFMLKYIKSEGYTVNCNDNSLHMMFQRDLKNATRNDLQIASKWDQKWRRNVIQHDLQMISKVKDLLLFTTIIHNIRCPKMTSRITSKWHPNDTQMTSKMVPKLPPNGDKLWP